MRSRVGSMRAQGALAVQLDRAPASGVASESSCVSSDACALRPSLSEQRASCGRTGRARRARFVEIAALAVEHEAHEKAPVTYSGSAISDDTTQR